MQFIKQEELKIIREGTEAAATATLNEVFSRVHNKASEDAINQAPGVMLKLFATQQAHDKLKKEFYARNPDFMNYREIVKATVFSIDADNPDKDFEFILSLSEPLIKGRIAKLKEMQSQPVEDHFNPDGSKVL